MMMTLNLHEQFFYYDYSIFILILKDNFLIEFFCAQANFEIQTLAKIK